MAQYKPILQEHNLDLSEILGVINELPEAGGGGAEINAITAASLPATVTDGQIVVITDTPAGTIYVDTDEPANPVSGDVWVVVGSSDYGVDFSETFRNGFIEAKQYNGSIWASKDSYIGVGSTWAKFSVGLPPKGTSLNEWSWAQLAVLADSDEDVSEYFEIGDEKELELTTGEIVPIVIGDFNRNTITSTQKKAQFAFSFKHCLATKYAVNATQTNVGSWGESTLRKTTIPAILDTFPAELVAVMKEVDVVTTAGNKSTSLVTTQDKLRLHSLKELGITITNYVSADGGTTYAYYTAGNRIKHVSGGNQSYWTRTPATNINTAYGFVNAAGEGSVYNPTTTQGVAFAFDI